MVGRSTGKTGRPKSGIGRDWVPDQTGQARGEFTANPRLYQAMDVFDMSHGDLLEHLQEEMYANPCLELSPDERADEEEGAGEVDDDELDAEDLEEPFSDDETDDPEAEFDWEEIILDGFDAGGTRSQYEPRDYAEPAAVDVPDLHDHLEDQLALLQMEPRQVTAAWEIVGNIDDDGRLSCSLEEVAEGLARRLAEVAEMDRSDASGQSDASDEPGTPHESDSDDEIARLLAPYEPAEIESALAVVHGLDPPGVGARDLRECLLIQLRRQGKEESLAYRMVDVHFDDLVNHRWTEITGALGVPATEIQAAKDEIGELDPKPGREFSQGTNHYIVPDMILEKVGGDYMVFANDAGMPRLRISPYYRDIVANGKFTDENKEYITSRMDAAAWLLQVVEQRRLTMLSVARFIVEHQREFFEHGPQRLKPLNLRTVAEELGISESTVSRVTSKKYLQTPRGVFPFRHFFSRGLAGEDGEVSTRVIKEKIRTLVAGEDPERPLADMAIVSLLALEGVQVARRTVAKYRTQLDIPVARARRRY